MKHPRGFTLIEFVIVITLIALLSALASLILQQHFKGYFGAKDLMALEIKTNIAADNLLRALKSAEALTTFNTNTLAFVNHKGENIVIDVSGTLLRRQVNGASPEPLCDDVISLSFEAFDTAFASSTVVSDIRFITMAITTDDTTISYSLMAGTTLRKRI